MSGYAAAIMTAQGTLDPGANVVSKPFTEPELLSALNAALTKEAAPSCAG
jgi:CheY-like chemotaxis protein